MTTMLIHCRLSSAAPAWGLEPPLPGSLLSELSREAAESKSFSSGRVLDGTGAMLESFILGINEKQALQVTVIANQVQWTVPTFIHIVCHNKRLFKKDGMCSQNSPGCSSAEE